MKNFKKKMTYLTASLLFTVGAQADTILGITAGASYWPATTTGTVKAGGAIVDLENDLKLDRNNNLVLFATLEHPIPLLPNIKVQYLDMAQTTQGTLNTSFQSVSFTSDVTTTLDLSHYDFTLYYEILDNWVSLDVGLTAKYFQGEVNIKQNNNASVQSKTDLNVAVPLLYTSAAFDLPFTGLSLIAEGSGISYSGNQLYDANIRIREQIAIVAFEAGYRKMKLKLDDVKGINVDADISGPFISAMLKF